MHNKKYQRYMTTFSRATSLYYLDALALSMPWQTSPFSFVAKKHVCTSIYVVILIGYLHEYFSAVLKQIS
jgi:hypothetical protein